MRFSASLLYYRDFQATLFISLMMSFKFPLSSRPAFVLWVGQAVEGCMHISTILMEIGRLVYHSPLPMRWWLLKWKRLFYTVVYAIYMAFVNLPLSFIHFFWSVLQQLHRCELDRSPYLGCSPSSLYFLLCLRVHLCSRSYLFMLIIAWSSAISSPYTLGSPPNCRNRIKSLIWVLHPCIL